MEAPGIPHWQGIPSGSSPCEMEPAEPWRKTPLPQAQHARPTRAFSPTLPWRLRVSGRGLGSAEGGASPPPPPEWLIPLQKTGRPPTAPTDLLLAFHLAGVPRGLQHLPRDLEDRQAKSAKGSPGGPPPPQHRGQEGGGGRPPGILTRPASGAPPPPQPLRRIVLGPSRRG